MEGTFCCWTIFNEPLARRRHWRRFQWRNDAENCRENIFLWIRPSGADKKVHSFFSLLILSSLMVLVEKIRRKAIHDFTFCRLASIKKILQLNWLHSRERSKLESWDFWVFCFVDILRVNLTRAWEYLGYFACDKNQNIKSQNLRRLNCETSQIIYAPINPHTFLIFDLIYMIKFSEINEILLLPRREVVPQFHEFFMWVVEQTANSSTWK